MNSISTYAKASIQLTKKLDQHYTLIHQIGTGGFSTVKLAIEHYTKKQVAIKIMSKSLILKSDKNGFENQCAIQKNLIHRNIVRILQKSQNDTNYFLIQQYCSGGDLLTKIQNQGPLSYSHANRILCQILQAMIYLKKKGIYHRDIKPENILFDRKGQVKLCDFGLACYCADNQLLDERCGSASYMSPEMAAGNQYCPQKSDVWSLGVLYHAMVTGEMLFPGQSNEGAKGQVMRFNMQVPWNVPVKSRKLFKMMIAKQNQRKSLEQLLLHVYHQNNKTQHLINQKQCQSQKISKYLVNRTSLILRKGVKQVIESVRNYKLNIDYAVYHLLKKEIPQKNNSICKSLKKQQEKSVTIDINNKVTPQKIKKSNKSSNNFQITVKEGSFNYYKRAVFSPVEKITKNLNQTRKRDSYNAFSKKSINNPQKTQIKISKREQFTQKKRQKYLKQILIF